MKKLALLAATAALAVLFAAPVFADSPGQLSNGDNNYKVRNVTKDGAYGKSVALACNETVKYSITLSNSDFGLLRNLTVKANLPNNISASATNANDQTTSVAGAVNVSVPSGASLKYVAGSTVRITSDGKTTTPVADGITTGGVNVGNLNGSTAIFVQFQAKTDCPQPPKNIKVCELATKKIITIREDQFNSSKHSKNLKDCDEVVKKIKVCELSTKKVIEINEKDFDSKKHSKNLADCAEKPAPGKITVCDLTTGKIITIKEDAYDASKHSKDLANDACVEKEAPVTPAELPKTGADSAFVAIALGVATTAAIYAVTGRKNLLG